jgi:choloylglycine hydrolase
MPRGMKRDGATGFNRITWTSKHGSFMVSMYDITTLAGINEKGLVANVLYLSESNYGRANGKPALGIAAWPTSKARPTAPMPCLPTPSRPHRPQVRATS